MPQTNVFRLKYVGVSKDPRTKGEMMRSRHLAKLLSAAGAAIVAIAVLAPGAMATTPAKGYEAFAGCPSPAENPEVFLCQRAVINGGHFQMGNKDVPITKPMVLVGGVTFTGQLAANKLGGLTPVKQQVPGGIIGLTGLDWLVNFLNLEGLKLYAVTELVGQPHITAEGTLVLPIRVHLENPVLGNGCYVGSPSSPITLNLTKGTTSPPPPNKPISGKTGTEEADPTREGVVFYKNNVYVDNSFAAPGANGCVLTLFGFIPISINGLVNSTSGLPAAAGTNETVQNTDLEFVLPEFVYP
jgi:hypothetical protein